MNSLCILLHACCGPCAIAPTLSLQAQGMDVTLFFANPNIHPLSEYLRRREALVECATRLNVSVVWRDDLWNLQYWLRQVAAKGDESPARCLYCYASRLGQTAMAAAGGGFDMFSTSLLYSRYQHHETIAEEGRRAGEKFKVPFFYEDFRDDWQKGIDISREWCVYRQPYCGCVYSEAERYAKKLKKLLPSA